MKIDLSLFLTKRNVLTEKLNVEHEKRDFFLGMMDGCELYETKEKYPDWIFWEKKDKTLFQQNIKYKYFRLEYSKIWQIFETKYGMNYQQIQEFTKSLLLTHLKMEEYTTEKNLGEIEHILLIPIKLDNYKIYFKKGIANYVY